MLLFGFRKGSKQRRILREEKTKIQEEQTLFKVLEVKKEEGEEFKMLPKIKTVSSRCKGPTCWPHWILIGDSVLLTILRELITPS